MTTIYHKNNLDQIPLDISSPCIIFLVGDLWAGKTTLSQHIIRHRLWVKENITSPTYTYYNHYCSPSHGDIYHFDLYRLQNYDEFFAIWAEEIFDNNSGVIIVEWPQLITDYYKADMTLLLWMGESEDTRRIELQ
jgi:tRNA threonylcarbamoyladenosine biosynthesis protein TsaE